MKRHVKLVAVAVLFAIMTTTQTLASLDDEILRKAKRTAEVRANSPCYKEALSSLCQKVKDTSKIASIVISFDKNIIKKREAIKNIPQKNEKQLRIILKKLLLKGIKLLKRLEKQIKQVLQKPTGKQPMLARMKKS